MDGVLLLLGSVAIPFAIAVLWGRFVRVSRDRCPLPPEISDAAPMPHRPPAKDESSKSDAMAS